MIILKSSDKENRLPRQSGNKTEGLGKFQVPQNQKLSPSVPSICSDSHT
jgi:hypothetical protein